MHVNYIIHNYYYGTMLFSCIDVAMYMKSARYQIKQWPGQQGSAVDNMHLNYVTVVHWHLKTHSPQFF